MKTQAYFIPHCDNNTDCDLGAFWYTCPHCGKRMDDYEIWWKEDDIWKGKEYAFQCEECKTELIVGYDPEKFEYYVEKLLKDDEFGSVYAPITG